MTSGRLPERAAGGSKGIAPGSEGQAQLAADRGQSVHGDDLAPEADASPWGPLGIRDYRLHLLGSLAFSGSLWVVFPAVGWIALELTDSPSRVTLANVVWFSSYFFLALPAGVAADLVDRRRLMIAARAASALLLAVVAGLTLAGLMSYPLLLIAAVATSSLIAIELPARQAFIAMLVPPRQLVNALALLSSEGSLTRVVAPLLTGFLLAHGGASGAFLTFVALNVLVVAATLAIRTPGKTRRAGTAPSSPRRDLADGLRYLARDRDARSLVLASVLSGSAAWVYVALLPVMTRDVLGGDAFLFGVLSTAIGVGQIPAALGLALYKDYRWPGRSYVASVILLGVAIIGFANSTSVPLSIVLLAVTGFAFSAQFILLNGMLLRLVEPEYHGRVMGALNITWGANVVGLLAAGAVVDVVGVAVVVGISGGAVAASALLIVAIRPQLLRL